LASGVGAFIRAFPRDDTRSSPARSPEGADSRQNGGVEANRRGVSLRRTPKRYHYEYEKHGSCCVFLAFEPHTGFRYVEVRQRRTAVDYAEFMHNLIEKHYSDVEYIRLVQDNLNTHTSGSFYEVLNPKEAFDLSQRFEMHYTPKKGSWLNMAEIEFAALSKQCLDRRIPTAERLRQEVVAWADKRNRDGKTVNWTFSQREARNKLKRHYKKVQKFI
jgi:hypothetical protein